jgi:repressor LexA
MQYPFGNSSIIFGRNFFLLPELEFHLSRIEERIRELIEERYGSVAGLSRTTGIPATTIYNLLTRDFRGGNIDTVLPLCHALDIDPDALIGGTLRRKNYLPKGAILPTPVETVLVPVYGRIAAGEPVEMIEIVEYANAPTSKHEKHPYAYFLIVSGDSMNKEILDGHLALIDPNEEVHNGDTVAVNVNGYDATLKVWHRTANSIVLSPNSTNSEYKDIIIDETDPNAVNVRLLGKLVWAMYPEK